MDLIISGTVTDPTHPFEMLPVEAPVQNHRHPALGVESGGEEPQASNLAEDREPEGAEGVGPEQPAGVLDWVVIGTPEEFVVGTPEDERSHLSTGRNLYAYWLED